MFVRKFPNSDKNRILTTEINVLRRLTVKSRIKRTKNGHITEIMGVKEKIYHRND